LIEHGAVSKPVAGAMAEGVREALGSDWAISTTGIAGPTGGTVSKPVGLVYTATASKDETHVQEHFFPGNRQRVRLRATLSAMDDLRRRLRQVN
jgi:PncC family amidohydrolase